MPLILGEDVQTLCDANYVNNPTIKTWEGGLEIRIYPAGTSQFTLFDGADIRSVEGTASSSVAIGSPTARPILLRILAPRPSAVMRDGAALSEVASPAAFKSASEGWLFDTPSGFLLVKFPLAGGPSQITF